MGAMMLTLGSLWGIHIFRYCQLPWLIYIYIYMVRNKIKWTLNFSVTYFCSGMENIQIYNMHNNDLSWVIFKYDFYFTDNANCSTDTTNGTCITESENSGFEFPDRNFTWTDVQSRRNNAVTETCTKYHFHSNHVSWGTTTQDVTSSHLLRDHDNIHVDGRHNVLFCSIPKVACSSWKAALALLTNNLPNHEANTLKGVHFTSFMNKIGLPSASALSLSQLQIALNTYTKIMVVRHPLERLVSAYRDKFRTYNKWTKHFQLRYGRKIALLYRGNDVTVEALKRGHDVTFEEFLTFIVDDVIPESERVNPHWDTYQHLCHPCHVKYDHVIKFETLEEDNTAILKRYFSVSNATEFFPKRNMKSVPSKDIMMQYYSNISKALIYKVYNMFKVDLDMFGYDISSEILHPLK